MDEKKTHALLKAKLRELEKKGWVVNTSVTKPSKKTGCLVLTGWARSPLSGELITLSHYGAEWVNPKPWDVGNVHFNAGPEHIRVTEEDFLRDPNKLFSHVDQYLRDSRLASPLPRGAILAGVRDIQRKNFLQYLAQQGEKETFTFRNQALMDLWNNVFVGQISDGMWEDDSNSGWQYWSSVQTRLGSKTTLGTQGLPIGVKSGFAFNRLIPEVGDEMLEVVQRTEPSATLLTVKDYTREIMLAMRAASKGEAAPDVKSPAATIPVSEGDFDKAELANTRNLALKVVLEGSSLWDQAAPTWEVLAMNKSGKRDGKYHYFALLRAGGSYQAMSAYGAIGKKPRAVVLGDVSTSKAEAEKLIQSKLAEKARSGYQPVDWK
jgi:hypothetical protein